MNLLMAIRTLLAAILVAQFTDRPVVARAAAGVLTVPGPLLLVISLTQSAMAAERRHTRVATQGKATEALWPRASQFVTPTLRYRLLHRPTRIHYTPEAARYPHQQDIKQQVDKECRERRSGTWYRAGLVGW